jgi:hypothetical protein
MKYVERAEVLWMYKGTDEKNDSEAKCDLKVSE